MALNQKQTQKNKGGMTDIYMSQGTYVKSFYTVMMMPSSVKVGVMGHSEDGIVGPKTLAAMNARNPRELFDMIKIARFDFIEDICKKRPSNNKFKRGWMNRINDIAYVG